MPDLNREPVTAAFRAGSQRRSCNSSVCVGPEVMCQKICQSQCQKICQKECQKICLKEVQKECGRPDVRKNVQKCVRKNVRKKWGELEVVEDIISMMFDSQLSPSQV